MSRESKRPIRQELMLGLIYPAVLGTILYQPFFTIGHVLREQYHATAILWIKWTLVLISIGFYVCDYLYIIFTKRYYWWSFLCDIVFLLAFYATVIAIDVDNPVRPPNHKVILLCYLIFLLVYLVWDGYEFLTLPRGKERGFYRAVVFWELPSLLVIGVFEIITLSWNNQFMISIVTIIILSVVTTWFGLLVSRMRKFT
ncbi:MAG TPA: hypothetical protein VFU37_10690 [Pyrinomonadaceae bacterium]|nr:hypothetical protein [Pyrinomonadaceae bacterium]